MGEALFAQLGPAASGALCAGRTQRPARARHFRADAADTDQRNRAAALHDRPAAGRYASHWPACAEPYAAIDQDDTNWIVVLKDVGPDVSVHTARPGETEIPDDLRERELTRGWLKASHRALDPERSKPWRPWHPLTRAAQKPVEPGKIKEYEIEILSTGNLFKAGHRICLDITSIDLPSGLAGAHDVEYAPYHICSSKTVVHKIYHDEQHPSHLVLPVIPLGR